MMNKSAAVLALLLASTGVCAPAEAEVKHCAKTEWPEDALRNEYQGVVALALLIDVDGDVYETRVEKSSGYPILDQAAAAALGRCKFKPPLVNGRATPALTKISFNWTMYEERPEHVADALANARAGVERGEAASQYLLGQMYLRGAGVDKDRAEAEKWLRLAAAQGHAGAQDRLAMLLIPADGYAGDAEQAMQWFRKAAEQGRARSQYFVGAALLQQGRLDEAKLWLQKSAAQHYPSAQAKLASLEQAK